MSSLSLRDQLLQAGLVSEQQVKEAERQAQRKQYQGQKQQPRAQRNGPSPQEIAAQKQAEAKAARDQELNRKQQEKAQRKALYAQIRELVSQNRIARPDVEETYNFIDGGKVRRIRADAALRERVTRGEVVLVRCEGRYELVPPDIAQKIRERDPRAVVAQGQTSPEADTVDEAYKDFVVPDDLIW
ncbi:MAG TPA: DUF2058 domain-containing protein [Steroidobacteraceae bacterium]|jgi:uncharacterized protein YaiL (DUF2058 family)|nr:DUF2058 domain-containing protein [Steroidobacteraceae bacterium]